MAGQGTRYSCRRPMGYGGKNYDQGQVIVLRGLQHDEQLTRLHYVEELSRTGQLAKCAECGGEFTSAGALEQHGRKRHPVLERTEAEEEAFLDREERRLQVTAPLALENTVASRA